MRAPRQTTYNGVMNETHSAAETTLSEDDVTACVRVLRAIEADRSHLTRLTREQRRELLTLAGLVAKPERHNLVRMAKAFRRAEREAAKERDRKIIEQTGLRIQRRSEVYAPLWLEPPKPEDLEDRTELHQERTCYVCKKPFTRTHRYYDSMCAACGDFNYAKREQTADLSGHYALVTGARVKIGFQASLKLLRAGAHVIVTTRFPIDAAERYSKETDFSEFSERLQIHGLDLRHTPSVEIFTRFLLERLPRLDYILNNACQTVRRPAGFFQHLLEKEAAAVATLPRELRGVLARHDELRRILEGASADALVSANAGTLGAGMVDGVGGVGVRGVGVRGVCVGGSVSAGVGEGVGIGSGGGGGSAVGIGSGAGTGSGGGGADVAVGGGGGQGGGACGGGGALVGGSAAGHGDAPFVTAAELRSHAEGLLHSAALSQRRYLDEDYRDGNTLFPAGRYDEDRQQVDLREINSWRLRLHEVETPELLEVQLVNAIAPYILNARLKPLMVRTPGGHKHIVNVSAMEGQFYRATKTDKHPHTNMAKAALNMMTRTSAPDFVKGGIHMNAVDTGWVTDEDPAVHAARKAEEGFAPPLDIIDGAARIVDPIFVGRLTGTHVWGQFLKDYKPTPW
jgi:NAD(P)-dependent dehydrogenase (short-subunit alcohol dehydrogenase family)